MMHAKLFSVIVVAAIGIYGVTGYYFLPLAHFEGGLTRLGMLPESRFGWTKEQPAVPHELLRQSSWEEADVLVVGDSFTEPRLWQSALTRRGMKVHSETWSTLPGICEDFTAWSRGKGFTGRYVIIEAVERNVEGTFARSLACTHTSYRPTVERQASPPPTRVDRSTAHREGKLSIGIKVYLNAWLLQRQRDNLDLSSIAMPGSVHVISRPDGCELFSHPQCADILFYDEDRVTDMGTPVLENMEKLSARITDATPIWVVIPDKSTVYMRQGKQFWGKAESRLYAPNLLQTFKQAIESKAVDLYPANETHLSTAGYLMLGENIFQSMPR